MNKYRKQYRNATIDVKVKYNIFKRKNKINTKEAPKQVYMHKRLLYIKKKCIGTISLNTRFE